MNITELLSDFVVDFDPHSAGRDVIEAAKVMVLDGLGVMIAGASQPAIKILREYAEQVGGREECTVVGAAHRSSPPLAAFVNGCALHVHDYEIQGATRTGHGTSNILPPTLSLAEKVGADAWQVLGAVIVGWEVNCRVKAAGPGTFHGFHTPGVIGPMGVASASGKILGLTKHQMKMAYGIAGSRASGLNANRGTMVKSNHPGNAGRMGVEAAMLAALGYESNEDIFGAHLGYITAFYREEFNESAVIDRLSEGRYLVEPGFNIKFYPAEVWMQRVIQAAVNVRKQHDFNLDDVEHVEVEMSDVRQELSRPQPNSGLDGKFSYQYCASVGLTQDHIVLRTFTDDVRFSPAIEAILPKLTVTENTDIPKGLLDTWVIVRVSLKDGQVLEGKADSFKGQPGNPMSRDDRISKFTHCTEESLGAEDAQALIDAVEHLEEKGSLDEVFRVMQAVRP